MLRVEEEYLPKLIVTRRANEGNNTSIYVQEGVYETNYTFNEAEYWKAKEDPGMAKYISNAANWLARWQNASQPRVYFVMPSEIATLNQQAEAEHCSDFILAYELSLGALQVALDKVATTLGPLPSVQLARAAVIDRLRDALPMGLRDIAENIDLCGKKFVDLCEKSKIRDSNQWHTWGLEYLGAGVKSFSSWTTEKINYLTGKPRAEKSRIFLRYTQGQAQVGRHPSASIIGF